jgi:hypothetical protein
VPRAPRVREKIRSPMTPSARQEDPSTARRHRGGWHAFVPNAGHTRRSVPEAGWCSRHASRVARLCNRLKTRGPIAPLCGTRTEPMAGRTSLLTLGLRVCTVMACVLRRSRETAQASLPGVPPEHKHKWTDTPTAERMLQAFSALSLTSITPVAGADILRRLPPLSG